METPQSKPYPSRRPPLDKRTFRSEAIEKVIAEVKASIQDPELAWLFENCFPNTLDTTVDFEMKNGKPDTYVITGDIDAMWLRDSSAQVQPYLQFCPQDIPLSQMIAGVIHRQNTFILLDPYANAFYKDEKKISKWQDDNTLMRPGVHERKWELDSLSYCVRLAYHYWKITGDTSIFDDQWKNAMQLAVSTMISQQRKNGPGDYSFTRDNNNVNDTLVNDGFGPAFRPTGMICSPFRNSDDAAIYLFNIPENLFAVTSLRQLAEMLGVVGNASDLAKTCLSLADEVERAVLLHGVIDNPLGEGKLYVYECDGMGNHLLIDDAGLPSLTSIPYFGFKSVDDPIYQNSRKFAQSAANPYFYKGNVAEGTGSPHIGGPNIWPMGIIGRALTSMDDREISFCLEMLKRSSADTGFLHESFDKDDAKKFTRKWFAWVNTLFGELILKIHRDRPHLLQS